MQNQILSTSKFLSLDFTVARKDTMLAIRVGAMMRIAIAITTAVTIFKRRIMARIAATFLEKIAGTLSITRVPMALLHKIMQKCDPIHAVMSTIALNWVYLTSKAGLVWCTQKFVVCAHLYQQCWQLTAGYLLFQFCLCVHLYPTLLGVLR